MNNHEKRNDYNARNTISHEHMSTPSMIHAMTVVCKHSITCNIIRLKFLSTFSPYNTR